jgi:hypothetical protein
MSLRINMLPAMQELCHMEQTCPNSNASQIQNSYVKALVSLDAQSLAFKTLEPDDYELLLTKLTSILDGALPDQYRKVLVEPFYHKLKEKGEAWFKFHIELLEDPLERVAHAILQNFGKDQNIVEKIPQKNTEAVREVVSDLYQNFLRAMYSSQFTVTRLKETPSPVPNWYSEDLSTFSHPGVLKELGANVSIVNMPSRYATRGAVTWGVLGHEVAGHDILGAYKGSLKQLWHQLKGMLIANGLTGTAPYWSQWLEEAASDILGVLNMGPAAAFSLIAFLRTPLNDDLFTLSTRGYVNDKHPADLLRGFLVAYAVECMSLAGPFKQASKYAQLIMKEVEKDAKGVTTLQLDTVVIKEKEVSSLLAEFCRKCKLPTLFLKDLTPDECVEKILNDQEHRQPFIDFLASKGMPQTAESASQTTDLESCLMFSHEASLETFKQSAHLVAQTVMLTNLFVLNNHSFSDIRLWNNKDEKISRMFSQLLNLEDEDDPVKEYKEGYFAAHVVSAAVMNSIIETPGEKITAAKLQKIFKRMITILKTMHRTNPEWRLSPRFSESTTSSGAEDSAGADLFSFDH